MPKKKPSAKSKITMPTTFSDEPRGLVILYIGAGKGKTTAAMGMAVRAAGAGMNVKILQFVKAKGELKGGIKEGEWPVSCEINFLNFFDDLHHPHPVLLPPGEKGRANMVGRIENEQLGLGFVGILGDKKEKAIHVKAALEGLNKAREDMLSGKYQVLVLDELVSALEVGVLEERDIVELIEQKPEALHLVLTGHNNFPNIVEKCDLVTEMKMLKHPYYKGILAQRGIDY